MGEPWEGAQPVEVGSPPFGNEPGERFGIAVVFCSITLHTAQLS